MKNIIFAWSPTLFISCKGEKNSSNYVVMYLMVKGHDVFNIF